MLEPIDEEFKSVIHDIEKEADFKILEMKTDKDDIHLLVKSESTVSILAIIQKLKQETAIRL